MSFVIIDLMNCNYMLSMKLSFELLRSKKNNSHTKKVKQKACIFCFGEWSEA